MAQVETHSGAALREVGAGLGDPFVAELLALVHGGERTPADATAFLLRDLVRAGITVLEGRTTKALVPLTEAPWELCLVGRGEQLLMSVYRTGPLPEVRVLDRPLAARDLADQCRTALAQLLPQLGESFAHELGMLVERLALAADHPAEMPAPGDVTRIQWHSREEGRSVVVGFDTTVTTEPHTEGTSVRADLHALLFTGRLAFDVRGQRGELGKGFVFLHIERLLSMCRPLLEAFVARRALHLRVATGASVLGLRLAADGRLVLSITQPGVPTFTAPGLTPSDFALPVIEGALALAQGVVRCDRARARNLRLRTLRSEARLLRRRFLDLARVESKVNDDPALYRTSALHAPARSATETAPLGLDLSNGSRLRYEARWRAEVEGIDLAGTVLAGDRIVVPGARELHALDQRTGEVLWSKSLPRAATALAGSELLRLSVRGEVELRDLRDGELIWQTRIQPRVGSSAHAFAITAHGLPRVVVLAEGERHLVALDLATGEPRWRHTARHGGIFRLRRVGRLLVVVSGDASITALDAASGELVWRFIGTAPFVYAPTIHRETVVAAAGVPHRGPGRVVAIDAFTGALRWSSDACGAIASMAVGTRDVVGCVSTGREGVDVRGYDLASGAVRWTIPLVASTLGGRAAALNEFDGLFTANLPTGRVAAIDGVGGRLIWSHQLCEPSPEDAPRRLDVQMRSGALFVPQSSLAVLRPGDGRPVANADVCDLVPDLLRIDDDGTLFVGEESGYLACYELGARLRMVRFGE